MGCAWRSGVALEGANGEWPEDDDDRDRCGDREDDVDADGPGVEQLSGGADEVGDGFEVRGCLESVGHRVDGNERAGEQGEGVEHEDRDALECLSGSGDDPEEREGSAQCPGAADYQQRGADDGA